MTSVKNVTVQHSKETFTLPVKSASLSGFNPVITAEQLDYGVHAKEAILSELECWSKLYGDWRVVDHYRKVYVERIKWS